MFLLDDVLEIAFLSAVFNQILELGGTIAGLFLYDYYKTDAVGAAVNKCSQLLDALHLLV